MEESSLNPSSPPAASPNPTDSASQPIGQDQGGDNGKGKMWKWLMIVVVVAVVVFGGYYYLSARQSSPNTYDGKADTIY